MKKRSYLAALFAFGVSLLTSCRTVAPGEWEPRRGDEIIVAGQLFHTGTRVVTWLEPGGYDAYRVERRFSPYAESSWEATLAAAKAPAKPLETPNRYSVRENSLTPGEIEQVRGGGWDLATLQRVVDQLVLHYDACGISKTCFRMLQDHSGLSVHFLIDVDGTIYQTLDLKERARHATISNDRSVGIEIANIGAYAPGKARKLDEWYRLDSQGRVELAIPKDAGDPMIYTKHFTGRPARPEPVRGMVQKTELVQYDYTPEQYAALIKLTAALCRVFPKIKCDYPRDAFGRLLLEKMPDDAWAKYRGVLGHFHIQTNKVDPGPAMQWDKVIDGARRLLRR